MYSIGSANWNGLSKLVEECGEVLQVAGKLLATGGASAHWDGSDLRSRMLLELADLEAAVTFFAEANSLDSPTYRERVCAKLEQFRKWDKEQR